MFTGLFAILYFASVAALLGILDRRITVDCTPHGHGRRCNVHNGTGEWA